MAKSFSEWANERNKLGHNISAIKRDPRPDETYNDNTPLRHPVNAGWQDDVTKEIFWLDEAMKDG